MTFPGQTILIADEEWGVAEPLADRLRQAGCRMIQAGGHTEVLTEAMRTQPDMILLAVDRTGSTGLETLRKLKSSVRTSLIPVIVLTSSRRAELPVLVRGLGALACLRKPVTTETVATAIEHGLGRGCGQAGPVPASGRHRPALSTTG